MLNRSKKKLYPAFIGDCVVGFTTGFDRGKVDLTNIIGVIKEVNEGQKQTIANKVGVIKS